MKTKKFVGYVPKGESMKETLETYTRTGGDKLGMYHKMSEASGETIVKRTITLTWEDEPVKK